MRLWRSLLIMCAAAIATPGCAVRGGETDAVLSAGVQWPPAPLPARIRYLRSISSPADAEIQRGLLDRTWRFIKGAQPEGIAQPHGVHVDSDGRIYVVDSLQKKVHVFDQERSRYHAFPQKPVEELQSVVGVAASSSGRVYVSDSAAGLVHIFERFGRQYVGVARVPDLSRPTDLALRRGDDELLIVDTVNAQIVGLDTRDLSVLWRVGHDGEGHDAFHFPTSVAVSGDGSVFVCDSLNFRVQMLSPDLDFRGAFGQVGDTPGYFSRPKGIAVDSDDNIYVVDALFDNVQVFNTDGQLLLTFGNSGQRPGEFWLPGDIYIDALDRVYVSDAYNSRIQVFQYISEGELP